MAIVQRKNPLSVVSDVQFKVPYLLIGCLLFQILNSLIQPIGTVPFQSYVLPFTFAGILLGLLLNFHIKGVKWIFLGTSLNFSSLLVHGGVMPVSATAMRIAKLELNFQFDPRHRVMTGSDIQWLGDWIPFFTPFGTNYVLSVGDILIGLGIVIFILMNSKKIKSDTIHEMNWFTVTLFFTGIFASFYSLLNFELTEGKAVTLILVIILATLFDLFPVKLPSGDQYALGTMGSLFLLIQYGLPECILSFTLSLFVASLKKYRSVKGINWFRYLVTIGMYYCSALVGFVVFTFLDNLNEIIRVFLTVFAFLFTNQILLSGIGKTVMDIPFFREFGKKTVELLIPLIAYVMILLHVVPGDSSEQKYNLMYTSFFLVIIVFFAGRYTSQIFLKREMTTEFIRLLENRQALPSVGHGKRVGLICNTLLEEIGYPKNKRHNLIDIAIMHDIGKTTLPQYIFQKKGALTISEEKEYQSHCEKGEEIVKSIIKNEEYAKWILYHHERWDGQGFPMGLKKGEIPYESRIIALCNQLDHLLSRHSNDNTVFALVKGMSGTILDPSLVKYITPELIESIRQEAGYEINPEEYPKEELLHTKWETIEGLFTGQTMLIRYSQDGKLLAAEESIPADQLSILAEKARNSRLSFYETITYLDKTIDYYFYPDNQEVLIIGYNLTPFLSYRRNLSKKIYESYQDVIGKLSDGRIELVQSQTKLRESLGTLVDSMKISVVDDVGRGRDLINKYLNGISDAKIKLKILLAVSEGITNIIKHAVDGRLSLYANGKTYQILIEDHGSGIPLHEIPKTILVSGYSSKKSLGKGFSVISKAANRLRVYTGENGTSLLLEFDMEEDFQWSVAT